MTEWALRRFWTEERVERSGAGWHLLLDDRPVRTPDRNPLNLPTEALARAVAAEWAAQEDAVRPDTMPMTRRANVALDRVPLRMGEVAAMLQEYGETDLVCYRAAEPEQLVAAQAEAWDPLLDWARAELGAALVATVGVIPVAQPERALAALGGAVAEQDAFGLTALHDLVTRSGSLVIGLAAQAGAFDADDLWGRSRLDETWQQSRWGLDAEAARAASAQRQDFMDALAFFALSRRDATE